MGKKRSKNNNSRQARFSSLPKPDVFSYYSNQTRAAEPVTRTNPRAKPTYTRTAFWQRTWVRNFPSLVALAAITLSVLYCLGLSTTPRVVVSANSPQSSILRNRADYQQGAQNILNQSILSRTKFTINTASFEKAFRNEFPEIADVSVALPLVSRQPVLTISSAQPQLILTAQSKAFVLDKRGTVIMQARDLSSAVRANLPVVDDQSGLTVMVGKTILPADDIEFITGVAGQFKGKQLAIESITLPRAAHQVVVKLVGQPYYIKMNIDTDVREAAGSYLTVKQNLEETHSVPTQYIDVRIPGRAYYK